MKLTGFCYIKISLFLGTLFLNSIFGLDDFFSKFRNYEEIRSFLDDLVSERVFQQQYNIKVILEEIGQSHEGRGILCVRFEAEHPVSHQGALIIGGAHGNEWITVSSILYTIQIMMRCLAADFRTSVDLHCERIIGILRCNIVHFIPLYNPDGYVYTWTVSGDIEEQKKQLKKLQDGTHSNVFRPPLTRLWRPNRKTLSEANRQGSGTLHGVDLNRNWGTTFNNWGLGVTQMKSSNYQGSYGFSEPETASIRDYAIKHEKNISALLDVHCCLRNVIAPFSLNPYNDSIANQVAITGERIVQAMQEVRLVNQQEAANFLKDDRAKNILHKSYFYERRPEKRKPLSSGISTGWAFNEMGWKNSYTIELAGRMIMPAELIPLIGKELLAGILAALHEKPEVTEIRINLSKPRNHIDTIQLEAKLALFSYKLFWSYSFVLFAILALNVLVRSIKVENSFKYRAIFVLALFVFLLKCVSLVSIM